MVEGRDSLDSRMRGRDHIRALVIQFTVSSKSGHGERPTWARLIVIGDLGTRSCMSELGGSVGSDTRCA